MKQLLRRKIAYCLGWISGTIAFYFLTYLCFSINCWLAGAIGMLGIIGSLISTVITYFAIKMPLEDFEDEPIRKNTDV